MQPSSIHPVTRDLPELDALKGDLVLLYAKHAGLWRPLTIPEAMEHVRRNEARHLDRPRRRRHLEAL